MSSISFDYLLTGLIGPAVFVAIAIWLTLFYVAINGVKARIDALERNLEVKMDELLRAEKARSERLVARD